LHAISVRDDTGSKLTGIGVIDKIVTPDSEPVFRADGYLIRITSTTQLTFTSDLNSLSNISTNSWIHFEGKRDKSGILIATKASFLPAKPTHFAAIPGFRSEICSTDGLILIPRQALAILNDAGYDLQQAPEAWRLLAPNTCSPTPAPSSIRTAAATC
jgi:hypothetical protein